jgi:spore coat protein U-like protein
LLAAVAGLFVLSVSPSDAGLLPCNGLPVLGLVFGTPLVTAAPLAFGSYNGSIATADTTVTTITVACMTGLAAGLGTLPAFTITLTAGNAGSYTPRGLSGPTAAKLNYNIYTNAGMTTVWGDGVTGGSASQSGGGTTASTQSFTGYGAIPIHQFVPAGNYTDMITVTVSY